MGNEATSPQESARADLAEASAIRGLYGISVAAELTGVGIQTLRLYERRGLLNPARTQGGSRRYSNRDVERIRRIGLLVEGGVNIAGIARILDLEDDNTALSADNARLEDDNWELRQSDRPRRK